MKGNIILISDTLQIWIALHNKIGRMRIIPCGSFQIKLSGDILPCSVRWADSQWAELQHEAHRSFCRRWETGKNFREDGCAVQPNDYDKMRNMRNMSCNVPACIQVSSEVAIQDQSREAGRRRRERKGRDAQSSVLLTTSPLLICSPHHPNYQQKPKDIFLFSFLMIHTLQICGQNKSLFPDQIAELVQDLTRCRSFVGRVGVQELLRYWSRRAAQVLIRESCTGWSRTPALTLNFQHGYSGHYLVQASRENINGNTGTSIVVAFWGAQK